MVREAGALAALKRAREKERRGQGGPSKPREKQVRDVVVPEAITVGELANRMAETYVMRNLAYISICRNRNRT